jgi:hypothetical protein
MARTVSKKLSREDRSILRSIYYKQGIPRALLEDANAAIAQRMKVLEIAGLIGRTPQGLRLTDSGVKALRKAYGTKRPPLIDFKHDARLPRSEQKKEFIVGSSLASDLAREVSAGE